MPVEQSHRSKLLGYLFFSFWLAAGSIGMAQDDEESKAGTQPYSLSLTTKLHSTGHSPYSGVYITRRDRGVVWQMTVSRGKMIKNQNRNLI
jgi:hypothetical protein